VITTMTRVKEDVSIIYLDGRLIAGDATVLYDAVQSLTGRGVKEILINMDQLDLMDSSGLGELGKSAKLAMNNGVTLKLTNLGREVRRTLEAAGYLGQFEVFDSEPTAVASFRG
jgi:anti-sigma B factor antagonist